MVESSECFDSSDLGVDFELSRFVDEMTLPDLYVWLEIDMLAAGGGVLTDRDHASSERYEADNPANQIGGQISPFTLTRWMRHGCEEVLQIAGATACHPGEAQADVDREDIFERDLSSGYHERGSCQDDVESGCVVFDLFGDFSDGSGSLVRRPMSFSPVRANVDVTRGEAEAHFRKVSAQVRSRNDVDDSQSLRYSEREMLVNIEGTWKASLRELKPEFVGLLIEAVSFLDAYSDEYKHQLTGARNFGGGIADVSVVNPLYSETELRRVFHRGRGPSATMEEKDAVWRSELRPLFVEALQARVARHDSDLPMPEGPIGGEL